MKSSEIGALRGAVLQVRWDKMNQRRKVPLVGSSQVAGMAGLDATGRARWHGVALFRETKAPLVGAALGGKRIAAPASIATRKGLGLLVRGHEVLRLEPGDELVGQGAVVGHAGVRAGPVLKDEVVDLLVGGFELLDGGGPGGAETFVLGAVEHAAAQEDDLGVPT